MTWAVFHDDHMKAIGEIIGHGNERVTAIVGGTLLESTTRRTLSERFRQDAGEITLSEMLLKPGGTLGDVSAQINILFLLRAFDDKAREAMRGLASIRNAFAHHLTQSFSDGGKEFKKAVSRLKLHEGLTHYPHHLFPDGPAGAQIEPIQNNRDTFIVNLKLALLLLMQDRVSHEAWTNRIQSRHEILEKLHQPAEQGQPTTSPNISPLPSLQVQTSASHAMPDDLLPPFRE